MSTTIELIGAGLGFGALHVLTGPDHLSALATLSANVGNWKAFHLGIGWGIGHSTGLLIVGIPLIALSQGDTVEMSERLERSLETLVGIFMLLLGSYGMVHAFQKRRQSKLSHMNDTNEEIGLTSLSRIEHLDVVTEDAPNFESSERSERSLGPEDLHGSKNKNSLPMFSSHSSIDSVVEPFRQGLDVKLDRQSYRQTEPQSNGMPLSAFRRYWIMLTSWCGSLEHGHKHGADGSHIVTSSGNWAQKSLAIGIGIVHGIAGPGGVLGLIPAVKLHDWRLASIYLGSFCGSSIVVMGCFAASYGTFTAKIGYGREFQIDCISAGLSIFVGILWLVLLSLGILHDFFS